MPDEKQATAAGGRQPLSGVRVLDVTHVIAGPYTTYQLALLGADVMRVERMDGDDFVRYHGGTPDMKARGLGASFLSQNACKRSIAIDLKQPRGVELLHQLAASADVMMENFRPGVADRLGIGFAEISKVNSRIVYCSLSGYGPSGPLAHAPAYDHIVQGVSGMMAMTGTPESGPIRVGFPIVDYVAGQTATLAIMAALMQRRQHDCEIEPQHLTVPMLDSLVGMMGAAAIEHETTGRLRGLEGNEAFSNSPFSGRFDTADGQIVVTANTTQQARALCEVIASTELDAANGRLSTATEIEAHLVDRIQALLCTAFLEASALEWERRLAEASVPAAAVRTLADILAHPQLEASGLMRPLAVPELGMTVDAPGLPFRSTGWAPGPMTPAPTLGRDTDEILREAGYSDADIVELRRGGIVR